MKSQQPIWTPEAKKGCVLVAIIGLAVIGVILWSIL